VGSVDSSATARRRPTCSLQTLARRPSPWSGASFPPQSLRLAPSDRVVFCTSKRAEALKALRCSRGRRRVPLTRTRACKTAGAVRSACCTARVEVRTTSTEPSVTGPVSHCRQAWPHPRAAGHATPRSPWSLSPCSVTLSRSFAPPTRWRHAGAPPQASV